MFMAALFTIAKMQKQPKGPPIDEWIMTMLHTYEYYTAFGKLNFAVLNNMGRPRVFQAK